MNVDLSSSGSIEIVNSAFSSCTFADSATATTKGGIAYINLVKATKFELKNTYFHGNTAKKGNDVFFVSDDYVTQLSREHFKIDDRYWVEGAFAFKTSTSDDEKDLVEKWIEKNKADGDSADAEKS